MRPLVNVASFGLIPVPSMLPGWSELHCHHRGLVERIATQAELAELDLQLRQAQAASDRTDNSETSSQTPPPAELVR